MQESDVCNLPDEVPSPAFVPTISRPFLDTDCDNANKEKMENTCKLQRVVASKIYSSFKKERLDNIMAL